MGHLTYLAVQEKNLVRAKYKHRLDSITKERTRIRELSTTNRDPVKEKQYRADIRRLRKLTVKVTTQMYEEIRKVDKKRTELVEKRQAENRWRF